MGWQVISIHALRKESDSFVTVDFPDIRISIHALRKESDPSVNVSIATFSVISIHALRKESDALPTSASDR